MTEEWELDASTDTPTTSITPVSVGVTAWTGKGTILRCSRCAKTGGTLRKLSDNLYAHPHCKEVPLG